MPLATMASAASRMILSVTLSIQMYQLFQPMCGVSAKRSPTTMRSFRSAEPKSLLARSVTTCVPTTVVVPPSRPVLASRVKPAGRPVTANCIGRFPVAAIV